MNQDSLRVSATLFDNATKKPIPYAKVYNKSNGKGVITNGEGYFLLENFAANDTIIVSYLGYEKLLVLGNDLANETRLYLKASSKVLKEVLILADDAFLYELVNRCKKSQASSNKTAKTYYTLKSTINNKQVELVESYNNAVFSGYNVDALFLKNGRIALHDFDQRFFISTESSKALYMHKLFSKNDYFPTSPFELNARALKKQFELFMSSKFKNTDNKTVYVINYQPKKNLNTAFSGKIWIDSAAAQIMKVNLTIKNAENYPFMQHGNIDALVKVDMDITKTFTNLEGKAYVNAIDFNYQISYKTIDNVQFTVNTNAILYAYDYTSTFTLPKFEFNNGNYADYRKIIAMPYNSFFWQNSTEFVMNSENHDNKNFIENEAKITSKLLSEKNEFFEKGVFEHPYVFWSKKRIKIREETSDYSSYASKIPSERYNLAVQIYMDVNFLNDSLHFITTTIFDPFETYYHYPLNKEGLAFLNMYFDLAEIHQRKLKATLKELTTEKEMLTAHQNIKTLFAKAGREFFLAVEHGTNKDGMLTWNAYIQKNLGIDNVSLFNLYADE